MLQTYDWIPDEKKYFGQPNTAYDFKATDPKEAGKRIQKLTETRDKLSKSVNMRAMNMLTKAEEQVHNFFYLLEGHVYLTFYSSLYAQGPSINYVTLKGGGGV